MAADKEAGEAKEEKGEVRQTSLEAQDTPPHHLNLVVNAIMFMELTRGTALHPSHAPGYPK